jgi:hypothetical protein
MLLIYRFDHLLQLEQRSTSERMASSAAPGFLRLCYQSSFTPGFAGLTKKHRLRLIIAQRSTPALKFGGKPAIPATN